LPEISVENLTIDDIAVLKGKVFTAMENALIENKAKWIQHEHRDAGKETITKPA